ncbi:MAG: hypothetical protein B7Y45_01770 [Sphingomonas sp. 28-66-16]|nr:MAG: hypothetical protein B7Y45_01770 [Sphingomonas sp. 28-66-16]
MKRVAGLITIAAAFAATTAAVAVHPPARGQAGTATLTMQITNVRNANGVIRVDVCTEAEFLKKCRIFADAKAETGTTMVTIENVPFGVYGVSITHDENKNGKVDRGLFGLPKEGIGFSNDAPIRMGPPSWSDARIEFTGPKTISMKMRYFMGPSGPR